MEDKGFSTGGLAPRPALLFFKQWGVDKETLLIDVLEKTKR